MLSFPSSYTAEKNKKTGASPIWILAIPWLSCGTYYLTDRTITIGNGWTAKPWIADWGIIDENIGDDQLGSSIVSDFSLDIIIDPNSSPNIETLLWSESIETIDCTLYLWFEGISAITNPPVARWVGNIIDFEKKTELRYSVKLVDQSVRIDKYVGTIIDGLNYIDADPDEYGKISNIIYGAVEQVPCRAIVAGDVNNIADYVDATQTTIECSDSSYFPASGIVGLDLEEIIYTGNTGTSLTGCTRGAYGTTATTHNYGAAIWEILPIYVYQIAEHPVKSIGDVFVDNLRITSVVTKYTGQSGDEYPAFPGQAIFTVPSKLTKQQAIDLLIDNNLVFEKTGAVTKNGTVLKTGSATKGGGATKSGSATKGGSASKGGTVTKNGTVYRSGSVSKTGTVTKTGTVSTTVTTSTGSHTHGESTVSIFEFRYDTYSSVVNVSNPDAVVDGSMTTQGTLTGTTGSMYLNKARWSEGDGVIARIRRCFRSGTIAGGNIVFDGLNFGVIAANTTYRSALTAPATKTWAYWNGTTPRLQCTSGVGYIVEAWFELELTISKEATGVASSATTADGHIINDGIGVQDGLTITDSHTISDTIVVNDTITVVDNIGVTDTIVVNDGIGVNDGISIIDTLDIVTDGDITVSGNSVANVEIGQLCTANVEGYQDDASGTITGTPYALIERPDHVMKHFLYTYGNWPVANFYTNAASQFTSNNFKFSVLINEKKKLKEWLNSFAVQCRCWFRIANNKAYLLWRPDTLTSAKTITAAMIKMNGDYTTSTRITRSDLEDVINVMYTYYYRDWYKVDDPSYYGILGTIDATSVARYGEKEKDLFTYDFITSDSMALNLQNFYLARLKDRKKIITLTVFLDNCEIEFGDAVTIQPLGLVCEVRKVGLAPGNISTNDTIELVVMEY